MAFVDELRKPDKEPDYTDWTKDLVKQTVWAIMQECKKHKDDYAIKGYLYSYDGDYYLKKGEGNRFGVGDPNLFVRLLKSEIRELGFTDFEVKAIEYPQKKVKNRSINFWGKEKIKYEYTGKTEYEIYIEIKW